MRVEFLSPLGGLLALGALLPLVALLVVETRARRLRAFLGLANPTRRTRAAGIAATVAVPILLGVGAAQPVIRFSDVHRVRTDAEAYYIFDVTNSMEAAGSPGGRTRFERAVAAAEQLHQQLSEVPSGIATLTDRVLPSLLPTGNDEVFTATLEDALRVGRPPPRGFGEVGTLFAAVDTLASGTFYGSEAKYRIAIVLTDGESRPFDVADLRDTLQRGPSVSFFVLRFWHDDERIWKGNTPNARYRSDPNSEQRVDDLARATGGRQFGEGSVEGLANAVEDALGSGPEVERGQILRVVALGRWAVLAALFPLLFLFWRRNLV